MKKVISVFIFLILAFSAMIAGAEYLEEDSEYLRSGHLAELLERYEAGEFGDELYYFDGWAHFGRNIMWVLIYRDGDTPVILEGQYSDFNRWEITEQSYAEYKVYFTDTNFDAKPKWDPVTATDYKFGMSGGAVYNYIHFTPDKKAYVRIVEPGALKRWTHGVIRVDNYDELVAREEKYTDVVERHKRIIDMLHTGE